MTLLTVFLPLVNFLLLLSFGRLVSTKTLATFVIASMFSLLFGLIYNLPGIIEGVTQVTTLGV